MMIIKKAKKGNGGVWVCMNRRRGKRYIERCRSVGRIKRDGDGDGDIDVTDGHGHGGVA
jgi:hypothetical protein